VAAGMAGDEQAISYMQLSLVFLASRITFGCRSYINLLSLFSSGFGAGRTMNTPQQQALFVSFMPTVPSSKAIIQFA